jgi:sulfur relay (sulfurtransferase) complex TusBCD TusD component (DsrE family)
MPPSGSGLAAAEDHSKGLTMNFRNQTIAVLNEQVEQKLEAEICKSARTGRGYADSVDHDVKAASNNVDMLIRRMSLCQREKLIV